MGTQYGNEISPAPSQVKVKIWSRTSKKDLEVEVSAFIASIGGETKFISANLTGDQGVMVVYRT
jgi:hypothetical protein